MSPPGSKRSHDEMEGSTHSRKQSSSAPKKRRNRTPSPSSRRSRSKSPVRREMTSRRDYRDSAGPVNGRSPPRTSKRSPEEDHYTDRKRNFRSNPHRRRSPSPKRNKTPPKIDLESLANAEDEMAKMMGFGGFETTKNKKVDGNIGGMAKVNKPRKFRQYMNRKGGFNRPLDYIA